MAHARLSGIFRTAGRDAESRSTGDLDLAALPRRRTSSCSRSSSTLPRDRGEGRPRARAASHHRLPRTSWRRSSTAGTTTPGPSARPRGRRPSRRGCCWPGRPASCWPTRWRCWASPPPTGCDRMSLLVVGSIALDSIFTPFGETADALGGSAVYFSVAGSLLTRCRWSAWWAATTRSTSSSGWPPRGHRLERRRARRGRELPLEGQVLLRPAEPRDARDPPRRLRRLSAQAARRRSARPRFVFLGNIDPELQLGVLEQVQRAVAGRLRHDELLDPGQEGRRCSSCCAGWTS